MDERTCSYEKKLAMPTAKAMIMNPYSRKPAIIAGLLFTITRQ